VPLDPALSRAAEEGRSAFEGAGAAGRTGALPALRSVINGVLAAVGEPPLVNLGGGGGSGQPNSGVHAMENLISVPA